MLQVEAAARLSFSPWSSRATTALPGLIFPRNQFAQRRVCLAKISLSCMSNGVHESHLFSNSDKPDGRLVALILNYKLPTQVCKLLQKGIAGNEN